MQDTINRIDELLRTYIKLDENSRREYCCECKKAIDACRHLDHSSDVVYEYLLTRSQTESLYGRACRT